MTKPKNQKRDLYYTNDHEWIDFQGSVAYVGACTFKLKGVNKVDELLFAEDTGLRKQGDLIVTIQYDDYKIPVHMPVDGKIISINDALLRDNQQLLLDKPEENGWVALIVPSQPYERKGLMKPEQYKLFAKPKF